MKRNLGTPRSIGAPFTAQSGNLTAKDPYMQFSLNHAEKMMKSWKRSLIKNLIAVLVYFLINALVQLWIQNDWEALYIAVKALTMLWTTIGMTVFTLEAWSSMKYYNSCKQVIKELT